MRPELVGVQSEVIHKILSELGWLKVEEKSLNGCFLTLLERCNNSLIVIEETNYWPQIDGEADFIKELESQLT